MLRYALRVVHVVERAAAMLGGAGALQFGEAALVPELHGEADDGAALLLEDGGDGRRVHATRHGDRDQAELRFLARGERIELDGRVHAYADGHDVSCPYNGSSSLADLVVACRERGLLTQSSQSSRRRVEDLGDHCRR